MLNQLTINNYAIVDHLDIELKTGMSVVTGETGAGKSIMLDALGLTLGDRADKDVIRSGASKADISACFTIQKNPRALQWLQDKDYQNDDESECILRRVLTKEGRSKAYINSQPTSLNDLKELGEMLIDIHSQHEHQSLLKTNTHLRLLDEFCGLTTNTQAVTDLALKWRHLNNKIESSLQQSEDNSAQQQLIRYQVKELEELNLAENELENLEKEHEQLSHAESSLELSHQVLELCNQSEQQNIQQSINQSLHLLQNIHHRDKHQEEAEKLLNIALIQIEEAATELSQSIDLTELNPERLATVDTRMAAIHQLARKYRANPKELLAHYQQLCSQLEALTNSDETIDAMQVELADIESTYQSLAKKISAKRKKGALTLEQAINKQLSTLGMNSTKFKLSITDKQEQRPQSTGTDNIEFLISTNPGQEPKALIKVASGGELSRISLAIQVVTAQTSVIPSLVFDEVDVGIGGSTAKAVGELLRELGEKGQVLCVTHQAQVAGQGHQHLHVSKRSTKNSTQTLVSELDSKQRVIEIARMLGGDDLSENSLAHAREMIN